MPRYLAKFQSITNIRTHGFWTFPAEFTATIFLLITDNGNKMITSTDI